MRSFLIIVVLLCRAKRDLEWTPAIFPPSHVMQLGNRHRRLSQAGLPRRTVLPVTLCLLGVVLSGTDVRER
jgi:hypothetical protein